MLYHLFLIVLLPNILALTISVLPYQTTDIVIVGEEATSLPATYSSYSSTLSAAPSATSCDHVLSLNASSISSGPISSAAPSSTSSLVFSYSNPLSLGNSTTRVFPTASSSPCVCFNNGTIPPLTTNVTEDTTEWTGPDWSSYPTSYPSITPIPSPLPTPRPFTDPTVAQLIQTTQDHLLNEYNLFGVISCFLQGSTTNCGGPWLFGIDWSNHTLPKQLVPSTVTDSSYECSSDETYLSSEKRVFYGFTASNISDSLQSIAHSSSMYAAAACIQNSSCTLAYQNDTKQMYFDFRGYINSTFFATMANLLPQNESLAYCPPGIISSASLLTIPTTHFDGSKEYFGLHDAIFIPGMTDIINGTIEEGKKELGDIIANNARKVEGTFLNMVFFSYEAPQSTKRSQGDEVYPGCLRRDWVIDGCKGIIPPREYDLAGTVLPMKDRDHMEYLSRFENSSVHTTDLIARDANCDSLKSSIQNSILNFETGKAALDVAAVEIAAFPAVIAAAGAAVTLGAPLAIGYGIAALGGGAVAILMVAAACEAYNTCDRFPKALVAAADAAFGNQEAALGAEAFILLALGVAAEGPALAVLASVTYIGLIMAKAGVETEIDAAIKSNQQALACCGNDCSSPVCQQAGLGCLKDWSSFWGSC